MLKDDQPLQSYAWSSYPDYLRPAGQRARWLRVDRLLGEMGIPKDSPAGRREFAVQMEQRRGAERDPEWKSVRRGWCLGDEQFRSELLEQAVAKSGENHFAAERKEAAEQKAQRILRQELAALGWRAKDLRDRRKGDAEKVRLARRLRAETAISLKWVAEHLWMGSRGHAANRIYARNQTQ